MNKATLVIMAAGIGSRFGGGIKQLAPVGPSGEIIMDYSIYDALEAGFDKVVLVIRKDLEKDFKEVVGKRIENMIEVEYAYQEIMDIPEKYQKKFSCRTKPWGTGQAILCCADIVDSPFLVINADDYYGKEAFAEAFQYLTKEQRVTETIPLCMVGFKLKNTMSVNGGVTRGVCKVNSEGYLIDIVETHDIRKYGNKAIANENVLINLEEIVSMNMWGMHPKFFEVLKSGFTEFLEITAKDELKKEYLLPTIIGNLLKENKVCVKVLQSKDQWFGVTYKEDREYVIQEVKKLIVSGKYPQKLS